MEMEVYQEKANHVCSLVAVRWTLRLVSNRYFTMMIARMGFAHGRLIARYDVHGVRPIKRLMCGMGCITPSVKRNRVVCAANTCITTTPSALALQSIVQVAKELFNESEIDNG